MILRILTLSLSLCLCTAATAQQRLPHFVEANALHTLYHELAHALINQFRIPILGQEEDAADNFATLWLARDYPETSKAMISDVATAWFMLHEEQNGDFDLADNHDLDAQRAFRTICMLYGLDPAAHKDLAKWAELPRDLFHICEETAQTTLDGWEMVLEPALRQPDSPEPDVTLVFEPPTRNNVLKVQLEQSGLLQDFTALIRETYAWPHPIAIHAMTCNQPNAFWDPETRRIEFCYEILGEWMTQQRRDTRTADARFRQQAPALKATPARNPGKNVRQ